MKNLDEVIINIKNSLSEVLINDRILIDNDANERTISSSLICYLKEIIKDYDIDSEYNRHGSEIKTIDSNTGQKIIIPDIVVHKRNNDRYNLVAIEIKKSTNPKRENDEEKLKSLTEKDSYDYKYGVLIILDMDSPDSVSYLEIFQNGEKVNRINYIDDVKG